MTHIQFDDLATLDPSHYRYYDYLRKRPQEPKARCVEDEVDLTSPTGQGPILWLQGPACQHLNASFIVCQQPADAFLLIESLPRKVRCVYEVVLSSAPQRLWIDWELYEKDIPGCSPDERATMNDTIEMQLDLAVTGALNVEPGDAVIACSSGMTTQHGYKYSFHVYVGSKLYPNTGTVKATVQDIVARFGVGHRLGPTLAKGFDMSVYKSTTQNFRMVGCHKDGRWLEITKDSMALGAIPQYTLIQPPEAYVVGMMEARAPTNNGQAELIDVDPVIYTPMSGEEVNRAVALVSERLGDNFTFAGGRGRFLSFTRQRPSECEVSCGRVHDRDNMFAHVNDDGTVVLKCRRNSKASIKLGTTAPPLASRLTSANLLRDQAHPVVAELCATADTSAINDDLPSFVELLREHDTCCIRAPMGIGKTNELLRLLNGLPPKVSVLILSFRLSFTAEIVRRLEGLNFHHYRDSTGAIYLSRTPRVVVQMESLRRVVGVPDLVVLDESESIIEQFMSPTMKYRRDCFTRYATILSGAKKVLAMDAMMTERTLGELQRHGRQVHLEVTQCQRQRDTVCSVTANRAAWELQVLAAVDAGQNIAIASGSAKEVATLQQMLLKKRPDVRVQSYTAKTDPVIKERCFADVNAEWVQYQVVLFSPTVLAGLSFEQAHFHQLFGYFHNNSVSAQGAIQMLGRVRNVTDKRIVLCVDDRPVPGLLTAAAVEDYVQSRHFRLMHQRAVVDIPECVHIAEHDDGRYEYPHRDGYYQTWIVNEVARNRSRADFTRILLSYLAETGMTLELMPGASKEDVQAARRMHAECRRQVDRNIAEAIAGAADLTAEEHENVRDADRGQLEPSLRLSLEKVDLRRKWNLAWTAPLEPDWVEDHVHPRVIRVYKNLRRLHGLDDTPIANVLADMTKREQERRLGVRDIDRSAADDLHEPFVATDHALAIRCLEQCGFTSPWTTEEVPRTTVSTGLTALQPELLADMRNICQRFERKHSPVNTHVQQLGFIGTITAAMYGIKVKAQASDRNRFYLQHSRAFELAWQRIEEERREWQERMAAVPTG